VSSSNEEQTRTLYWLLCRMNAQCDAHFVFYARSVEEAEGRAAEILAGHKFERVHLKPWPYEFMRFFRLELPGTLLHNYSRR
jgi:hypothetical protein